MNIWHDDIDTVAEQLASLAYTIYKTLEHEDGVLYGHEATGAAWILCGLLHDFAARLKRHETSGIDSEPGYPAD